MNYVYDEKLKPKNYRIFMAIFKQQLMLSWANKQYILYNTLFFILSATIFRISIDTKFLSFFTAIGVILVLLLFNLLSSSYFLVRNDYVRDFWPQYMLMGVDLVLVLLAKLCAYVIAFAVPLLFAAPFVVYMLCNQFLFFIEHLLIIGFFAVNTVLILLSSSAILISHDNHTALALITLPFHVPNIIFSLLSFQESQYLLLLLALFLFNFPICLLFSSLIIKIIIMSW